MKSILLLGFACLCSLLISHNSFCQEKGITVNGKVTDSLKVALDGVTVEVKGTRKAVRTNEDGTFSLKGAPAQGILVFTSVGYTSREVSINGKKSITISLTKNSQDLEDVMVIGYGVQKRSHFTGASSSLDVEKERIDDLPTGRLDKALQGRFSGLEIRDVSGQVGDAPTIRVRGAASFSASSSPLVVIDGTPSADLDLSDVDMGDVKNIEVLKDAASTAIYGSRGANGVILVTTKKGANRKPQFNVKLSQGMANVIKYYDTYSVEDAGRKEWLSTIVAPWETDFLKAGLEVPAGLDASGIGVLSPGNKRYISWDQYFTNKLNPATNNVYERNGAGYYNLHKLNLLKNAPTPQESITTNEALNRSVFFSASGANNKTDYYLSGAYRKEEGVIINNHFTSVSLTYKMNSQVTDKIKVEVGLIPKYQKTRRSRNTQLGGALRWLTHPLFFDEEVLKTALTIAEGGTVVTWAGEGDYTKSRDFRRMWLMNDDFTDFVRRPNGDKIRVDTYSKTTAHTSYAAAQETEDFQDEYKLTGNIAINWKINKDLVFRTNLATYLRFQEFDLWTGSFQNSAGQYNVGYGSATYSSNLTRNLINENTLNYKKNIDSHHLNFLAGFSIEDYQFKNLSSAGRYFPNDEIRVLGNAGEIMTANVDNYRSDEGLVSMFGRVNYDLKERYLLSLVMRRDGSSQFGANNRWGNFPSISVGWRIGQEEFMKKQDWISNLTLRASYGVTGNNRITRYSYTTGVNLVNYIFGTTITNGYAPTTSTLGNQNLAWEQTNATNIGLSAGVFNGRISFDLDFYEKKTKALLLKNPIVNISGQDAEWANIGQVSNKGVDFQINAGIIQSRSFNWDVSTNVTHVKNKLLGYGGTDEQFINGYKLSEYRLKVGRPLGEYFGYKATGEIWKNQADLTAAIAKGMAYASTVTGDLKLTDLNGDGKITPEDKTPIGDPYPDIEWGFTNRVTFKRFDLNFTFQGSHGSEVQNISVILGGNTLRYANDDEFVDEFHGNKPLMADALTDTDYLVEDASYVALRYATLGYTFPKLKARVYLAGTNLLYFMSKGYNGINPEYAATLGGVVFGEQQYNVTPLLRSFSIGFDIRF